MIPYKSKSGKQSGVTAYEIGDDFILVNFGIRQYKYSYSSCGVDNTEAMKNLALNSIGLSTFIAQNKPEYETI